MKVYLKAYMAQNVGDDLYLHLMLQKHPEIQFFMLPEEFEDQYRKTFRQYPNAVVIRKKDVYWRLKNKLEKGGLARYLLRKCDAVLYLGGSLFMENPKNDEWDRTLAEEVAYCNARHIPYHIRSCNFGPYQTERYRTEKEALFCKLATIYFRDRYSYQMFLHLAQAAYIPDAVFAYSLPKVPKKEKTFGISVIQPDRRRGLKPFQDSYYAFIAAEIERQAEAGYSATLFDFCTSEGDAKAAEQILRLLPQETRAQCRLISYTGDMPAFLKSYLSMERTLCTRFHAMILSAMAGQAFCPLFYSDKMLHVVQDLSLCGHYLNIRALDNSLTPVYRPSADLAHLSREAEKMTLLP